MTGALDIEGRQIATEGISEFGITVSWLSGAPAVNVTQGTVAANETAYSVDLVLSNVQTELVGGATMQVIACDFILSAEALAFLPKIGDRVTVNIGSSSTLKVLGLNAIIGGSVIAWQGHLDK